MLLYHPGLCLDCKIQSGQSHRVITPRFVNYRLKAAILDEMVELGRIHIPTPLFLLDLSENTL